MPLPRLTPIILAIALFMERMDSTIIATSLPAIAADIGTSPIALKLAVTSYLVALAVFIPISGWMSDRFGALNIFRIAIGVFMIGSIGCAFSGSIGAFVFWRLVQGAGGSMMTPVSRLLLVRGTPKHQLVDALAWLTIPALVGPILGPPVGGFFTTYLSWHWIFWINVPIGIAGIILVTRLLPPVEPREPKPLDFTGFFLSGIGFSAFVFGISVVSLPALPMYYGYTTIAIGILMGIAYLWHAKRTEHPLLDPRMFRYPIFRASIVGASNFRMGLGALPFLMPLMLQLGFGMSALGSGLITFSSAVGALLMKTMAQRITRRYGFRNLLVWNTLVSSLALIACGLLRPAVPSLLIILFLLITGFFRSLEFTCVNTLAFADVEEADMSQATSFSSTAQQLALSIGIGIASQTLNLSLAGRHATVLGLPDFTAAFCTVGLISLSAMLSFRRLAPDAGSSVSGHRMALADMPVRTTHP